MQRPAGTASATGAGGAAAGWSRAGPGGVQRPAGKALPAPQAQAAQLLAGVGLDAEDGGQQLPVP